MNKKRILICTLFFHALSCMEGTVITTGFHSELVPDSPANTQQGCIGQRTVQPEGRRLFSIYLPPGYDQNDTNTRYPVIYWLVGFNGFNEPPANENKPLLDYFISNGQMVPVIVVYPDPSLDLTFRFPDPGCVNFPPGSQCDLILPDVPPGTASYGNSFYINSELNNVMYEDYFIQELIPYIDTNYNTIADRNFRAITGHSMGGYGTLYLGTQYPETFASWAALSPTPPWMFTNPETWDNPPAYDAFTLNSILLGGIEKNNGFLSPCNEGLRTSAGFTDFVFAMAGAFSPNTTNSTPFFEEFKVNPPIHIDENGKASLVDGIFSVVDFASNPNNVFYSVVDKSVVLNQSVVDIWNSIDPFFLLESNLDTVSKQAVYLDGGDEEPLNNVASRMFSDKLMENMIDNEYILYRGNHVDFIFDPCCARNTTVFKMFSASFAAAGTCATQISSKLMGNLTIELCDDASIEIFDGSILSIQTSKEINAVTNTNVSFNLKNNAAIHIGTEELQGGALQIGDPFTKAQLQEFNTGPPTDLADHEVRCSICLNDTNNVLEIGREGFLGIGIGVTGKSNDNIPPSPLFANFWGLTSLANLKDISIIINKGTLSHQIIDSGNKEPASLLAIDVSENYVFHAQPPSARILGGANMICTKPDSRADPAWVDRKVRLYHPTVLDMGNDLPTREVFLDPAAGVINVANFEPGQNDPYINNPISTSTAYTNFIKRGILQSTPLFNRGDIADPFSINTQSPDVFCAFLLTKKYEEQPVKLANLSPESENPKISYTQNASFIGNLITLPAEFEFPLIERTIENEFPDIEPHIPFEQIQQHGALGVQLEFNGTESDLPEEDISNVKELIRIYDPHININA